MTSLSRMTRATRRSFLAAAAATAAVLAPAMSARAADMDANAKALAKLDDDWSKAAATKDVDKVASFYAQDAIAYPPNEAAAVGHAAAKKVWATYVEISKSGELGFTSGTYEDSYTLPDGKLVNEKGKYLCVWKKQKDGSWKAIHDMWNGDAK